MSNQPIINDALPKTSGTQKHWYQTIRTRRAVSGYLFILPFIIGFLLFMVKPLYDSLYMSFCEVTIIPGQGHDLKWVFLQNFDFALTGDPEFNEFLVTELGRMAIGMIGTLVISFFVAVILNQEFKGRTLVRAIFFLPVILASGVLVGLESNNELLSGIAEMIEEEGSINLSDGMIDLLRLSGIGRGAFEIVFTMIDSLYDIIMASGIQIIVFLSGLQTIPRSLYEAADVEGCTAWERFWKITFPMVSPLLLVNFIYTIIDFFMKTDNEVMERINTVMYSEFNFGLSAAMSWIYFGVAIGFIALGSIIISRGVHYYE